jgi:hypothetical protein
MTRPYLAQLRAAAQGAERAEAELRQYLERRLETMSAERIRAYRRSQLVSDMIESARPIAARAECVEAQTGCVLAQAGWSGSDAGYEEVREQLSPLAALVHADLHGEPGDVSSMVVAALAAFENWYRERFGTEFPALQPRAMNTFQPLTDF